MRTSLRRHIKPIYMGYVGLGGLTIVRYRDNMLQGLTTSPQGDNRSPGEDCSPPEAWTTRRLTDVANDSLAQPAPTPPTPRKEIAECIEVEIERLREKRPHLDAKIKRAEHIITAHLAGRPRTQIVRARLNSAGRCRFLVRSLTSSGAVYTVYPGAWSCSCPAYHRTSVICKHSI